MMRPVPLAVVTVLLCWAATAHAECALVLWEKKPQTIRVPARAECLEAWRRTLLRAVRESRSLPDPLPFCTCIPDLAEIMDPRPAKP